MMGALSLFISGEEPTRGDDAESLERAASEYSGEEASETEVPETAGDTVAVVDLGSEEEPMSELRSYIKSIIDNG